MTMTTTVSAIYNSSVDDDDYDDDCDIDGDDADDDLFFYMNFPMNKK